MKINGVELEDLDIYDLEVAKKYDKAKKDIMELDNIPIDDNTTMTEVIEIKCNVIFNIFNTMFGEGTDKKVFGDKVNLLVCMKALDELIEQMNKKSEEMNKIKQKYSPNRAARRSKK